MAFPSVAVVMANHTAGAETLVHDYPASGIDSGDLLIAIIANDGGGDTTSFTAGTRYTSWVDLEAPTNYGSNGGHVAYLIADGTEDGGTLTSTVSPAGSEEIQAFMVHVQSWHGTTAPEIAVVDNGFVSEPDPPSLSTSWGSEDNRIIAAYVSDTGVTRTITSWPYADNQTPGSDAHASLCTGEDTADTPNPAVFGMSTGNEDTASYTIAIRPAAAGGGINVLRRRRENE